MEEEESIIKKLMKLHSKKVKLVFEKWPIKFKHCTLLFQSTKKQGGRGKGGHPLIKRSAV